MKPWTEDDFLENLMPHLRRDNRVLAQSCPDSELLTAFTEDQVTPFVRGAVTAHLAECRDCSEISARLVSFAKAKALPPAAQNEAEWINVEKRLGNWMDGFLRDNAAKAEATSALCFSESPKKSSAWMLSWAVGAAAVVVLAAGGVFFARSSLVDTASLPLMHVNLPPGPPPSVTLSPQTPSHAPDLIAPTEVKHPETSPKPVHEMKPRAVFPAPPVVASTEAPKPSTAQAAPTPSAETASNSSSQDAHNFSPPEFHPNDRIMASGSAPLTTPTTDASVSHASMSPRSGSTAPSAGTKLTAAPKPTTLAPRSVRLESGTRLWVRMNSTDRRSDGNFSFRGSLQQPVDQAGKVTLDRDAQVAGSGSVRNGKITVLVERVVIGGVSYKLKSAPGTFGAKRPGAGTAVEFDGGKVQEMWLGIASVYEKEP